SQADGLKEPEQEKELAEALARFQEAGARWEDLVRDHQDAADVVTLLAIRGGLGMILFKQGKLDAAVEAFGRAIAGAGQTGKGAEEGERLEKLRNAHAMRALAQYRLGEFEPALRDVSRALELDGDPAV